MAYRIRGLPVALVGFVLAGCAVNVTTTPPPSQPLASATRSASVTPSKTATYTDVPSPTAKIVPPTRRPTVTGTPTAGPLTPVPPKSEQGLLITYRLERQETIGKYIVRYWSAPPSLDGYSGSALTIAADAQPLVEITEVIDIDQLSGTDITGEGDPDLIVVHHTGGASCCTWVEVVDLGDQVRTVLSSPFSGFSGVFEDLDGNGVFEFITYDDSYDSSCGYPGAVSAKVIYEYDGDEYRPASPKYAKSYQADIDKHLEWAQAAKPANGDYDGTTKCSVLPLVLDYLYSGQTDQGWKVLHEYYTYPDVDEIEAWLKGKMEESPYYVAP